MFWWRCTCCLLKGVWLYKKDIYILRKRCTIQQNGLIKPSFEVEHSHFHHCGGHPKLSKITINYMLLRNHAMKKRYYVDVEDRGSNRYRSQKSKKEDTNQVSDANWRCWESNPGRFGIAELPQRNVITTTLQHLDLLKGCLFTRL